VRGLDVLTIVGSLRADSWNHRLALALGELAPPGMRLDVVRSDLPLYDADLDHEQSPPEVTRLRDRATAADGILVVTPEYNHALPGPLKNTLDWLSRPAFRSPLRDKPVTAVAATPGPGSPGRALAHVGALFVAVAAAPLPWPGLAVGRIGEQLDGDERLDPTVARRAEAQLAAFADWIPAVAAYGDRQPVAA
jgi:chromate reductase